MAKPGGVKLLDVDFALEIERIAPFHECGGMLSHFVKVEIFRRGA